MTKTLPPETVEGLLKELDDRCAELSEQESLVATLKAGATELRRTLADVLREMTEGMLRGETASVTATEIRECLKAYSTRLAEWDKVHSRP